MRGVAGQVTTGRSVALTRAAAGFIVLFALFLSGCPVGPDFVKPDPTMPENYRSELEPAEAASFADLPFWDVFNDGTLRDLIQEALANNYDLKTAIYNVEAAQHQVGITRSPLFPAVNYEGGAQRSRVFIGPEFPNTTTNIFLGAFTLAWEIDLWGRIRRATESSKAQMLAAEDIRRGIVLSLVATVASQYFNLQELDLELQIAVSTTESFTETEALFTRRYLGGVDSKLSVERAKAALHETAATIPQLEQQIVIQENSLCSLLGRPPGPIPRTALMTQAAVLSDTPPGLPSELLLRRPDILQAEEEIASTNALIGVAKANFFPRIGVQSLYGGQSSEIENIVKGPGAIWTIGGTILGPLFQGGALIEGYRQSQSNWEASKQQYMQTVLNALGEVSDALIAQRKLETKRLEQWQAVEALRESVRLSLLRYTGGLASYYEVLEAQQQLFPAENTLAQIDRDRLLAVVDLYRALGGGWTAEDQPVEAGFWPTGP